MTASPPGSGSFDVALHAVSSAYDPEDDRWRSQVSELYQGLDAEVGDVRREYSPVEGTKGGVATVILALGTAGAFTAAADYLRAWLGRDKSRRLEMSWTVDGRREDITITGDAIDEQAFNTLAAAAAAHLRPG